MIFRTFLFFLFLVPALVLGQEGQEVSLHEDISHEDEKLLNELTAEKARAAKTHASIEKTTNIPTDLMAEIQKTGELSLQNMKNMDAKTLAFLQKRIEDSHMGGVPDEIVRARIRENTKDKPLGKILARFPILMDLCVDFMKDPVALPALLGLLTKKDKLLNYFYVWLGLFIGSWLVRRYLFPKDWTLFKRICASLVLNLITLTISLTTFYFLFEKEISPTVTIIMKRIRS